MKKTNKRFARRLSTMAACLVLGLAVAGCMAMDKTRSSSSAAIQPPPSEVKPAPSQFGAGPAKIVSVNPELKFVVVDFSSRVMPPVGTRLNVYRGDKVAGTIQLTEPVRAQLATADILQGEVRVGDEAR
ncbi:MAG TPA: hypothetical protein VL171_08280 [Verrucomicrobiae bacterium]|nr:hypothetical protein [Verrucomicrobiae bacterium]